MIDLLVLDDQNLMSLARRPDIVREFPFFQTAASTTQAAGKSGCGSCGARASAWSSLNEIKRAIHELPADRKAHLKALLGAKQVRIRFVDRRNVVVKLTF